MYSLEPEISDAKAGVEPTLNGNGVDQPSTSAHTPPFLLPGDLPVAPSSYTRDNLFYDDHKIFLVGNHLFRVPINDLAAESQIFQDMMELPVPCGGEGLSDENPIRLEEVSRDDFRQLLRVLCPPKRFNSPAPTLSFSEWTSVLKLADMWCMDGVKEHAISNMSALPNIDPVDKIVVARDYNIRSWFTPCYQEILQRSQAYTERDVSHLGLETFLLLVNFRDRLVPGHYSWSQLGPERQAVGIDFQQVIEAELPDFPGPVLPTAQEKSGKKKKKGVAR